MGSLVRFLALAKASLLTARRYRIDWYGNVLVPVLTVVPVIIALWYGKKIGLGNILGTENYFEYYILGIVYWNYVEVVWSSILALRYYMRTGQLEGMLLTPLTPLEYILGWSLLGIAVTTITSLPLVALAVIMGGYWGNGFWSCRFSCSVSPVYNCLLRSRLPHIWTDPSDKGRRRGCIFDWKHGPSHRRSLLPHNPPPGALKVLLVCVPLHMGS